MMHENHDASTGLDQVAAGRVATRVTFIARS